MNKPIVTRTKGYAMLTQDQLLAEIQRLEGLVASVTAERDAARDLCVRSGYWQSALDDESTFVHVKETPAGWSNRIRPSAYDMPVGSVVVTVEHTYTRMFTDAGNHGWAREKDKPATIQSGWIEGLFSDGLVTEWHLP